jgi:hypothetical protein
MPNAIVSFNGRKTTRGDAERGPSFRSQDQLRWFALDGLVGATQTHKAKKNVMACGVRRGKRGHCLPPSYFIAPRFHAKRPPLTGFRGLPPNRLPYCFDHNNNHPAGRDNWIGSHRVGTCKAASQADRLVQEAGLTPSPLRIGNTFYAY